MYRITRASDLWSTVLTESEMYLRLAVAKDKGGDIQRIEDSFVVCVERETIFCEPFVQPKIEEPVDTYVEEYSDGY
jgi:hypothetical protein